MLKCTECKKETTIKTFDGANYPLCLEHYLNLANDSMYKFVSSQRNQLEISQGAEAL